MLASPSNDKSILTVLSFNDQLMIQGTSASLLPVSHSRTSHSSQKKEVGNTILRAGHLPTSEIQIKLWPEDQEEFLSTYRFKVENSKKVERGWKISLVAHTKICCVPLISQSQVTLKRSFGKTLCSIIKHPFFPPQHDGWIKVFH